PPLICVPVTDYDKLLAQFKPEKAVDGISTITIAGSKPMHVAKKGNYALVSPDEDVLKSALAAKANVAEQLAPMSGWIAAQDIAAVATTAGIKAAVAPMRAGLAQAKTNFPANNPQAAQVAAAFDSYDQILDACEKELTHAAIGLEADHDSNLHLTSRWMFTANSKFTQFAKSAPAAVKSPFGNLPSLPLAFAFAGPLPKGIASSFEPMLKANPQYKSVTPEQWKKINAALEQMMSATNSISLVFGVPKEGGGFFQNFMGVTAVDDSSKFLETFPKAFQEYLAAYKEAGIPGFENVKITPLEIGGMKAIQSTIDIMATLPPDSPAETKQTIEKMFGNEGKLMFNYIALGSQSILSVTGDANEAKQKLDLYKATSEKLADSPLNAKTLGLLSKDAQWVGLVDLNGFVTMFKGLGNQIDEAHNPFNAAPAFPSMPPLGFSAKASEQSLDTDLALPADTVKAIAAGAQQLMFKGLH
ncbi:MAG TPA: hypothetical protein VFE24_17790, partial [Pirellulales bacterium]|nr:hypothetical protein [Pirellulales bacterium]